MVDGLLGKFWPATTWLTAPDLAGEDFGFGGLFLSLRGSDRAPGVTTWGLGLLGCG